MSSNVARKRTPPLDVQEEDTFRYGWRFVKKTQPDGTVELEKVGLTLEDVLHPQEGDVIPDRRLQRLDAQYLGPIFEERAERLPGGLVLTDCIVDWGIPGVGNHSPDLSVFAGLTHQPPLDLGVFRLGPSGGHCVLAVEIVSPSTRVNDVRHKVAEYYQARVALYVLIDQEREGGPRRLLAYRRGRKRYSPVAPDEQGRLLLESLGLYLGLKNNRAVCYDAETGAELGNYRQQVAARQAAEKEVRKEARARKSVEKRVRAVEDKLREMEAELRRMRGENP
jgi:hypothetical protein